MNDRPCRAPGQQHRLRGRSRWTTGWRRSTRSRPRVDDAWAADRVRGCPCCRLSGWMPRASPSVAISCGGNLATLVALRARDSGGPALAFQLLVYPLVDFTDDSPSMREYAEGHFLTAEAWSGSRSHYVPLPIDRRQPCVSPVLRQPRRTPAGVRADGGVRPAARPGRGLRRRSEAGRRPGQVKRYDGMIHPFFSLGGIIEGARTAIADAAAALRAALIANPHGSRA